ncbi:site-specific integrase, partial [Micromonospora sp. ATA32]|nr:site-specific integrase [Micromonospora sp. ATA32]
MRGYLDHLTVERGLSGNTLSSYRRDLDRYLATLAAAGVTDLAAVARLRWRPTWPGCGPETTCTPPLAVSSAARAASAVRGLHRFALREG